MTDAEKTFTTIPIVKSVIATQQVQRKCLATRWEGVAAAASTLDSCVTVKIGLEDTSATPASQATGT